MTQQFFVYESIGTTLAHVRPLFVIDDPEFMKAFRRMVDEGRIVLDGDEIVSIDGVPFHKEDPCNARESEGDRETL